MGRSRGGLITKDDAVVDARGLPRDSQRLADLDRHGQ